MTTIYSVNDIMCFVIVFFLIGVLVAWACGSMASMAIKEGKKLKQDKMEKMDVKKQKEERGASAVSVPQKKNEEKKQEKIPVDLDLIKYVPEEKLGEVVNSLTLKYGISAAVIWAAISETRKNVAPVANTKDKVYWEDFYGDDRNRDAYLDDYELDDLDDDVNCSDSNDSWSSDDSWCSHDSFDSHDDFGHDDYGYDS